jgi:hypothetical protein
MSRIGHRFGKRAVRTGIAALVAAGTMAAAPAAMAGTSGQWPNNTTNGWGIGGFNWANAGQVVVNITANNADSRCVVLRSWNAGNPTIRATFGDTTGGSMWGSNVFEVHSVDITTCGNPNAVHHRLIIPVGNGGNYWQF